MTALFRLTKKMFKKKKSTFRLLGRFLSDANRRRKGDGGDGADRFCSTGFQFGSGEMTLVSPVEKFGGEKGRGWRLVESFRVAASKRGSVRRGCELARPRPRPRLRPPMIMPVPQTHRS